MDISESPVGGRLGLTTLIAGAFLLTIAYTITLLVYNAYFHPLAKFPGPKYIGASIVWYMYSSASGKHHEMCYKLHLEYGKVVRIGPNHLSFSSAQAYKDIYGYRPGKPEMSKDLMFYGTLAKENLVVSEPSAHARMRRLLAHAFSDRALRDQEDLMQKYIGLLMSRLSERARNGNIVDIVEWYNFTTFDIVGDLAFGDPFGSLETSELHPWVRMIFDGIKGGTMLRCARYWPSLSYLLNKLISKKLIEKRNAVQALATQKVGRRLQQGSERKDFTSYILRHNDEKGMSTKEIEVNANLLIIAGSETTATLLSGCTYYLLRNPKTLQKLTHEVRSSFKDESEITISEVSRLEYLLAAIDESFRMYPPAPTGLPRIVPKGGEEIDGDFVPGGTAVCLSQYGAYRLPQNFRNPLSFTPERWITATKNAEDQLSLVNPFSLGPRNCLGKNLAYAELKLILARIIWNFDMKLEDSSVTWASQNTFNLWEKGPLHVRLTQRV